MQALVDSPLLMLFVCVGVGCAFGAIRFGPVSFGAAGALFAALALSAIEPDVALPGVLTSLGLCVFCYVVGLTAGPAFVSSLRTGWTFVLVAVAAVLSMAVVALGLGGAVFGLDRAYLGGVFSGASTATPALGAVQEQLTVGDTPPPEPAVGYAVAYPFAVLITILGIQWVVQRSAKAPMPEDQEVVPTIVIRTIEVLTGGGASVQELSGRYGFAVSRLTRGGTTQVARGDDRLLPGDLLTITAPEDVADRATTDLGRRSEREPWLERTDIDFRRITLSRRDLVGKTLEELDLVGRFDAVVSRVRRGDVELVATPDLVLQMGDRLRVTAPRAKLSEVTADLGDSERSVGDINPVGLGLGLTIGLILAFVQIPLPGGGAFVLGTATAPLIVGVVLGALGRTGPIVWQLPPGVANTLNQVFLLIFLAAVGSGAGADLAAAFGEPLMLQLLVTSIAVCLAHAAVCIVGLRVVLKYGSARTLGGLTGSQLNPAPYAYAMAKMSGDQRIALVYALLFPIIMLTKVIVAQLMVL
jgi:putative transport protein